MFFFWGLAPSLRITLCWAFLLASLKLPVYASKKFFSLQFLSFWAFIERFQKENPSQIFLKQETTNNIFDRIPLYFEDFWIKIMNDIVEISFLNDLNPELAEIAIKPLIM